VQYAVGRIHFDTLEEYARYAKSVVAAETGEIELPRRMAFFSPRHDFDAATMLLHRELMQPLVERIANEHPNWTVQTALENDATKARLNQLLGGDERPAFLFAGGHGICFPNAHPQQFSHQGAILTQDWSGFGAVTPDAYYSSDDVTEAGRFFGMITFFFSESSAGTTAETEFPGKQGATAPHAFVARLPKRLLGHSAGGALAVIGHVDNVWAYSFSEGQNVRVIEPFVAVLNRLLDGHPVGSAMEPINQRYAELAAALAEELYGLPSASSDRATMNLRIAVVDTRNWIVLGDPAVRLPLKE
jgi:hypothetical protein